MPTKPIILLEFNELCPSLMTQFIEEGHLPNFKRLRDSSAIFTTEAKERAPYLEPWIQWINVHAGVPFSEHGVEHLGESAKVKQPAVWDLLSHAGMKVWICGSMNVHCTSSVKGDLLPDPWTAESMTRPPELLTYNRFIRKQVQEHSNASAKFAKTDYLRFVAFMLKHGLSLHTVKSAVRQLSKERSEGKRWRRAFILDLLQYDVFRHLYQKGKPDLSTFFLNSTAHMQHCYWRNMQPEVFKIQPTEAEQKEYSSAILEGYVHMDRLIARILDLVGDDATIFFSTAISQQPYLKLEDQGGKHIYRPSDIPRFVRWAGITDLKQCNPVMAEQFWLEFETHEQVEAAAAVLNAITVNGEKAFDIKVEDTALFTGFSIRKKISQDAVMVSPVNGASIRFFDLLYAIEGMKSGMHHQDGILWIRDSRISKSSNPRVALESIAPTILDLLAVPIPAHMKDPSLLRARPTVQAPSYAEELQPAS
ncbi:MAG TPA: hypothetical protein VGM11_08510 [Acidobacteriaceae bacterium]